MINMASERNELLKEVHLLRKKLRELTTEKEVTSLSSFYVKELKKKLKMTGILLAEGEWGGVFYSGDKIKKMIKKHKKKLEKMEMTAEHERDEDWGNIEYGKHTKILYNPQLKAAIYEANVEHPKAIQAIKGGEFKATSMRVKYTPQIINGKTIATNLVPMNNTLTKFPACKTCQIFTWKELSENGIEYYGIREKNLSEEDMNNIEGIPMSEDINIEELEIEEKEDELFEIKTGYVLVLPEEQLSEIEEITLDVMEKEKALTEDRRIVSQLPEGLYPSSRRKIQRRKGYYYIKDGVPIPYYHWDLVPKFGLGMNEELANKGIFKVVKNSKNDKYVLLRGTGKEGFGSYKKIGEYNSPEEANEAIPKEELSKKELDENTNKSEPKEEVKEKKEMTEVELRKKRCEYCGELQEDLTEHEKACEIRKDVIELSIKCKFCTTEFSEEKEVKEHLKECPKYKKYKEKKLSELSEEPPKEESPKEEPPKEEPPKEEVKEEPKEEPPKKEEPKKEIPKEEPKEEVKKEEPPKEEKKEEPKQEEATIVETPVEEVKEEEPEPLNVEDWSTPQKAALVLIKREEGKADYYED